MILSIIIGCITCMLLILAVIFKPTIKINKLKLDTFWIVAIAGAIITLLTGALPLDFLANNLETTSSINPLKIMVLLLSLTMLSITLDELGFFEHVASLAIKKVGGSKYKLFFTFYVLTAILTIFTSNDIVILTFTLFICYFSKNAKISPIPYLVMEFVTANTYSMLFIIGNPTNIYIASFFNISFLDYFKSMWLATILAGIVSLSILLLIFRKDLSKKMELSEVEIVNVKHKTLSLIAIIHLIACTTLLAISNYINLQMWIVTLMFALSLSIVLIVYTVIFKDIKPITHVYKRLPYTLCFFVLSMYIIVLSLDCHGISSYIANYIDSLSSSKIITALIYGSSSTITDNLINNIPMSLGFASILNQATINKEVAIFASIIGSNIGAYVTPIGALAGIMWMRILKEENVEFGFKDFIKYCSIVAIPTLAAALIGLLIII
ncbi:MAG: hypothetical protein J5691_07700 [Bacilli bacterium]|nr:hypothetical protein [Bacilli bacterium]